MAARTSDRINGLVPPSFHPTTTRLGATSTSGTTARCAAGARPSGAVPTESFHSTACGHSWTTRTTGPSRGSPPFQYPCRSGPVPGGNRNQRRSARPAGSRCPSPEPSGCSNRSARSGWSCRR
ncbi:hypothetical protein [Umezawaea sp.]|uniref:hypothetical protein n=1 Tax=Umezawaea sp. TaxID=1955258 RepID=UPI002ED02EA0